MKRSLHNVEELSALLTALHSYKVSYTLTYAYNESEIHTTEYWNFDIPDPEKLLNALIDLNVSVPQKIPES